jgi:hypothetical protein
VCLSVDVFLSLIFYRATQFSIVLRLADETETLNHAVQFMIREQTAMKEAMTRGWFVGNDQGLDRELGDLLSHEIR